MTRMARFVGMLILPLAITGCASDPVWTKAGADEAQFEGDSTACFRSASVQAEQQARSGSASAPQIKVDRERGTVRNETKAARKSQSLEEKALRNKLYSQCMQRKGYTHRGG